MPNHASPRAAKTKAEPSASARPQGFNSHEFASRASGFRAAGP